MTTESTSADDATRRDGSALSEGLGAGADARCWCHACRPVTLDATRMILCPDCGNKRCPKASHHANACTDSNEPGQRGSVYGGVCRYPDCHCPFDAPEDPNWCAKGLPHLRAPNVGVEPVTPATEER